jgi:two-component sensor histidine kinase
MCPPFGAGKCRRTSCSAFRSPGPAIYRCSLSAGMDQDTPRRTGDFNAEERQRLRIVHHRLRNASQAIESLLATEQLPRRWAPEPAPADAVDGAKAELEQSYQAVVDCHRDLSI